MILKGRYNGTRTTLWTMAAEFSYQTAGESHGPANVVIVTGMPAGLSVDLDFINAELVRRQGGYGRGGRQRIEQDRVEVLAGLRQGMTLGSPIAMVIFNRDARLDDPVRTPAVKRPRPGHADLAGSIKFLTTDCRGTLERASARETAARVAAGALARCLLREFGIETFGFVRSIGVVRSEIDVHEADLSSLRSARDSSAVFCPDASRSAAMVERIRETTKERDTIGGIVETHVLGCPPGLGSCMNWHQKLDARLAYAVMSIQAFKGVEIGLGFEATRRPGSLVHDPIRFDGSQAGTSTLGYARDTNNAGGLEGGMTNGQAIIVRGAMKPIATLLRGMPSVDLNTKVEETSQYERSDICAVPAASVVMENVVAFEVAAAIRAKFGGDSMREVWSQYGAYLEAARRLPY